jgi:hypothetical protein
LSLFKLEVKIIGKSDLLIILFINLLNIIMSKYFKRGFLATFFIVSIFVFGAFINTTSVNAQSMSTCQLIDLLISLDVIPADKAVAARVAVGCLTSVTPISTSTQNFISVVGSPVLELLYDSARNESQLTATFKLSIQAGNKDLNVYRNSNPFVFMNQTNNSQALWVSGIIYPDLKMNPKTDQYGQVYYTVPAGTALQFFAQSTANPKIMFAGSYYAKFNSVIAFNTDVNNQFSIESSARTNAKTIIGETSPYITSVTSPIKVGDLFVVKGARINENGGTDRVYIDGNVISIGGSKGDGSTSLGFTLPTLSAGLHRVQLSNKSGMSNIVNFEVIGNITQPTITYVAGKAADNGEIYPASTIGIEGKNLVSYGGKDTVVYLNGVGLGGDKETFYAQITQLGDTLIYAMAPSNIRVGAYYDLFVANSYGTSNPIRVKVLNNSTIQPSVTILSPNGGETYKNDGSQITVNWTTANVPATFRFDVIRLRDHSNGGEYNLKTNVLNDGQEVIVIPNNVPIGSYILEIKAYLNNVLVMDSSDSYFKIISNIITTPVVGRCSDTDGGRNYGVSGTLTVSGYQGSLIDKCQIKTGDNSYESTDRCSGINCYLEEGWCEAPSKTYQTFPSEYVSASNGCANGFLDNINSLLISTSTPSITILSPNGGETYKNNDLMKIKWSSINLGSLNVQIDLIDKGGEIITSIISSVVNTGSYAWNIPVNFAQVGTSIGARVMVSSVDKGPSAQDFSDSYFKIVSDSVIVEPVVCTGFKLSDWSVCSKDNQTRKLLEYSPSNCDTSKFVLSRSCTAPITTPTQPQIESNPSCGNLGRSKNYSQSQLSCQKNSCPKGFINLGKTYDCNLCCGSSKTSSGDDISSQNYATASMGWESFIKLLQILK